MGEHLCSLQLELHILSHCSLPFPPPAGNEISVAPPFSFMCHHPQLCIFALQALATHSHCISQLQVAAICLLHLFQECCWSMD